ncbi:hypothetical protein EDF56_104585 [Novosphingobium sp. PhB165]|nr:hypothetical protein EDF56_104585 [Novosphingobium sp. PhB165]
MTDIERLRMASVDDVERALKNASFGSWPIDDAALLEFSNLMLGTMPGQTAGDGIMWPGLRRPTQCRRARRTAYIGSGATVRLSHGWSVRSTTSGLSHVLSSENAWSGVPVDQRAQSSGVRIAGIRSCTSAICSLPGTMTME